MSSLLQHVLDELKDPDPRKRIFALDKIARINPDNALEIILPFLSDSHGDVRVEAAFNLGEIANPAAVPHLLTTIKNDSDDTVRAEAIGALESYRSSEILQCLLEEVRRVKRSRRPRQEVARQLGHYASQDSIDALLILFDDEDDVVRDHVVESLLKLNRPALRAFWQRASQDSREFIREMSYKALSELP
ncbi:HEAT repeat domain-containing protein [Archangium violaceum]|uniref:HEAT repeat domain-containing protein n=1 Tax=Archangium violaceum TaxID=83451 RepID=UPI000949576F|nr:HEAT repeat domain-containing protein [Archangium violaceum]